MGERTTSILLFVATLVCVFFTYGFMWHEDGNPLTSADGARDSAMFAGALMAILLAHEMGHWLVARRHGFALSLPYFIPLPVAFGTLGAVIRLDSPPQNRTGLLEMAAAGPLAGAVVAFAAIALGLPGTEAGLATIPPPPEGMLDGLTATLMQFDAAAWIAGLFAPPLPEGHGRILVFADPLVLELLGSAINGSPPGRLDTLHPLTLAGWVGCLVTAVNLLPVGQLDGGHIMTAIAPAYASRVAKVVLGLMFVGGLWWSGWIVWGALLIWLRAHVGLEVPETPGLSARAWALAALVLVAFALTFMPTPVEPDSLPIQVEAQ